jgi:hypothetical protein
MIRKKSAIAYDDSECHGALCCHFLLTPYFV